ncbi:hypothetical protein STINGER_85 [Mycobacterium phage Stinger]|uniref:Uncharacterized protein n=1 Tax=Mycobacterium phage Stinger TaxID=1089137 RepID=G8I9K6_9CAUD|nr:HNH endonuclease [Mycobacterium phage Stinger]AER49399.1 hypothetical protein STINGER_85 [Mycobacterium phage Stinger]
MDPDAALAEALDLARGDLAEYGDEVHRLAEVFLALDSWLQGGGFLPAAWDVGRS